MQFEFCQPITWLTGFNPHTLPNNNLTFQQLLRLPSFAFRLQTLPTEFLISYREQPWQPQNFIDSIKT